MQTFVMQEIAKILKRCPPFLVNAQNHSNMHFTPTYEFQECIIRQKPELTDNVVLDFFNPNIHLSEVI